MSTSSLEVAAGRNADSVRDALSKCNSFEDVRALVALFHGTCEEIDGDLRGGGYDGVFWTADRPTVAQAYIPRSGITTWYHKSDVYDRERPLPPCQNDSVTMRWALEVSGATREDLDITWNGLRPASWTIPPGWPTEGDWDDHVESLGYEACSRGSYEVSKQYGKDGVERLMPADWQLPGQLIIAIPRPGFEVKDPEWSEDALGYDTHNRVGDFDDFSRAGTLAFRMTDQLQSDYLGNVYHEAVGVLPAGISTIDWLAIPAVRHDGADHETFAAAETGEFIAFMKEINPSYKSEQEIANLPENRRYAVMTDSHRPYDKTILARMAPERSRSSGFWTETSVADVWIMDRKTAEEVAGSLRFNNPRIVRAEKARAIIERQAEEKRQRMKVEPEDPFEGVDGPRGTDPHAPSL